MILTRPIGIDLGTTNSAVAVLDPNERDLVLCHDEHGRPTTPSCVWWDARRQEPVVGHAAYVRKGAAPEPVSSIKRAMGTRMTVELGGPRSPAQVSSEILRALRVQVEGELGRRAAEGMAYDVSRAIVTVPAYFGLPAIEATREAATLAGLDVTELLHEPTAAAIYYSWKHNLGDGVYLVYDLGGGTFDVSVLRRSAGDFLVLGISGDNFLGGDDFDRRLAEHLRRVLVADGYELDLDIAGDSADRLRFAQLVAVAETAKKGLSRDEEVLVQSAGMLRDQADVPVVIEALVTRATFESLIGDLLERTIACCDQALASAKEKADIGLGDVDHVLLVGGSTYVPAVVERVRRALCRDGKTTQARARCERPIRDEPETAVALGAALRAAAGGIGIGDEERRVRVWVRGSAATQRERTTIHGYIEPLQPGLNLAGGRLTLKRQGEGVLGDVELKGELRFAFPHVDLEPDALNDFELAVEDARGQLVATLARSIAQRADAPQPVTASLSTAVLPKPIVLEGIDAGRLVRTVLLPEGGTLPTTAHYTFAIGDAAGHVRLPIYQASRIIKELRADVGTVPVGTPVDLEITCDEQVRISVRFSVAGRSFGGSIDPPPPDDVPTRHEVDQIGRRFGAALDALDDTDDTRRRLQSLYDATLSDVEEARRAADYPKLIARVAVLEGLIREAKLALPLEPSLDELGAAITACEKLLTNAVKAKPDLPKSKIGAELAALRDKGAAAYRARESQAYDEVVHAVGAVHQFLGNVTRAGATNTPEVDTALQAFFALDETQQLIQAMAMQAAASKRSDLIPRLQRQLQEVDDLYEKVRTSPVDVVNRCQVLATELRRMYKELAPEEGVPEELKGLVTLGPQAAAGSAVSRGLFDR